MNRAVIIVIALLLLVPVCFLAALAIGSINLSSETLWAVLSGTAQPMQNELVLHLRLPRAASAFATGGMLALAGVLMQVLLRNPLADPYILGISGGAAVATLVSMLLGISGLWLTGNAFLGALGSMLMVFGLAHGQGSWTTTRLLLCGVVIAAGWGALISFILAISSNQQVFGMLFWLMGDLSYAVNPYPGLVVMAAGLLLSLPLARHLNVLAHGDFMAASLGVSVQRLRMQLYLLASLLAAAAVTMAGTIGFIGLVIPHLVRLMGVHDHRLLLPSAMLLGGSLLLLADTLARTVIAPQQLPVGVITALLGIPLFLFFMQRSMARTT
jgi:iron complex transport system permease protein